MSACTRKPLTLTREFVRGLAVLSVTFNIGCGGAEPSGTRSPDEADTGRNTSLSDVRDEEPSDPDVSATPEDGSSSHADAETGIEPVPRRCVDLNCAASGRLCLESDGSADAECGGCLDGLVESQSGCVAPADGALGRNCLSDSDCADDEWCSTVAEFERCSPRVFKGEPHQMDFVFVPSGTFSQGTPDATDSQRPYIATLTRSYFVSRTEVTQGQWRAATDGTNPACFQLLPTGGERCSSDNLNNSGPVERVDFYAALAYSNWLSRLHGLETCYELEGCDPESVEWFDGAFAGCKNATFAGLDCTGYRLLTESEWERAARAGTTGTYYWGDSSDPQVLEQYVWYEDNTLHPEPVGQLLMNAYGLYDTSGNVYEWTWDWMELDGRAAIPDFRNYPSGSATDYLGALTGTYRSMRGGAFNSGVNGGGFDDDLRPAKRAAMFPYTVTEVTGLRLARTAP